MRRFFLIPPPLAGEGGREHCERRVGALASQPHPDRAMRDRPSPFRGGIKRASFAARILCGAGCAVVSPGLRRAPSQSPAIKRGDGAPGGAAFSQTALRRARTLRSARSPHGAPLAVSRLRLSPKTQAPGPRCLGRGSSPVPVQRAPRGGVLVPPGRESRASRVRGCEPRPRAPHLLHLKNASRSAPHEQVSGGWNRILAKI